MGKKNPFITLALILSIIGLVGALISGLISSNVTMPYSFIPWLAVIIGLLIITGVVEPTNKLRSFFQDFKKPSPSMQKALYAGGLLLTMAIGLCLRLVVIHGLPIIPVSDFHTYYQMGRHLAEGTLLSDGSAYQTYVAKFPHTIGFPMLILQPVFLLFGTSVATALYANLALSLGNIALVAHLGRKMGGFKVGIFASLLMAVLPSHVMYSGIVASEPSYTFFILLALAVAFRLLQHQDKTFPAICLYILLGTILAVANVIRPMAVIVLIAVALTILCRPKKAHMGKLQSFGRNLLCILLIIASYGLIGTAFTSKVQATVEVPLASGRYSFGYNLMVGVNTEGNGRWNETDAQFFDETYLRTGSADEAHQACINVALSRIQQDPFGVVKLAVAKYVDMWHGDDFGIGWARSFAQKQGTLTTPWASALYFTSLAGHLLYVCMLLFAIAYIIRIYKSPSSVSILLLLVFLGIAAMHMLLETQVRYHYLVLPIFILLASMEMTGHLKFTAKHELPPALNRFTHFLKR